MYSPTKIQIYQQLSKCQNQNNKIIKRTAIIYIDENSTYKMLSAQINSTGTAWTPDEVKRLIKSVKHTTYLYDPENPKYNDPKVTIQGWEIVSQMVGKPALECRGKWSNIASQLKKIEQNRKDHNSTPNWVYYNLIGFMLPFIQTTTPTKRERSPDLESGSPREKMAKITPNNASTSNAAMKRETLPNMAVASNEFEFPADEPTQFLSSTSHNPFIEPTIPNSPNSLPDHNLPDLPEPEGEVSPNAHFLKMILKEMAKLSNKDQSQYRIIMLTKLHEMLYKNE